MNKSWLLVINSLLVLLLGVFLGYLFLSDKSETYVEFQGTVWCWYQDFVTLDEAQLLPPLYLVNVSGGKVRIYHECDML